VVCRLRGARFQRCIRCRRISRVHSHLSNGIRSPARNADEGRRCHRQLPRPRAFHRSIATSRMASGHLLDTLTGVVAAIGSCPAREIWWNFTTSRTQFAPALRGYGSLTPIDMRRRPEDATKHRKCSAWAEIVAWCVTSFSFTSSRGAWD